MATHTLELIFFDAGGGHRAAAEALKEVLTKDYPDWDVRVTNLQEILKSADPLYILTGKPSPDYYNAALKMGLTYGSKTFLRGLQKIIQLTAPRIHEILHKHWWHDHGKPLDAVISLVPNFNGVMFNALKAARPTVPFVTIMTDMVDSPPHFWQEEQDQYIICGTTKAAQQARNTGWYRPERIFETSGMIINPSFYNIPKKPRFTRAAIGLKDGVTTALIMFGGNGSMISKDIVERLHKAKRAMQAIVMCGNNKKLLASLQNKKGCHAVGFTSNVADYMRLADVFIGKPGPGSISEAWRMGLPVIVEHSRRTMFQEQPNTVLVEDMGAGVRVKSFRNIGKIMQSLIETGQLDTFRTNVSTFNNQAVFEISSILQEIIDESKRRTHSINHT